MIKSLILVRHAKTEPRSPEIEDHQRQLTSAGIRSAKASLPRALALVENPREYRIWSSPAVRAWQTAEIVADAMGLDKIEQVPNLYSSEFMALRRMLDEEKGHLVLVGHNPFLEELADSLCPYHLKLNKCAVVCYNFPAGDVQSAELAWFVQGPDSQRWETLVDLETALEQAARKASNATWAFFDDPKDPDRLNDVRTALRNCRTLLDFAEPYMKRKLFRRTRETIDGFYTDTSDLRRLAIPSRTAEQYSSIPFVTPEAQRVYDRLRVMEAERNRSIAKLQTPARQKAFHEANQTMRAPMWKAEIEREGIEKCELKRQFKKMKRAVKQARLEFEALPAAERTTDAERKVIKQEARLDYLTESLPGLFAKEMENDDYAL